MRFGVLPCLQSALREDGQGSACGLSGHQQWRGEKKLAIFIDVWAVWKHNVAQCPVFSRWCVLFPVGLCFFRFVKECVYGSWS